MEQIWGAGPWKFDNDFARNVAILGVDSSSSSQTDNYKNNFLVLGEDLTYGINGNGSCGSLEKMVSINFTKANTKFCLSLHNRKHN